MYLLQLTSDLNCCICTKPESEQLVGWDLKVLLTQIRSRKQTIFLLFFLPQYSGWPDSCDSSMHYSSTCYTKSTMCLAHFHPHIINIQSSNIAVLSAFAHRWTAWHKRTRPVTTVSQKSAKHSTG